MTEEHEAPEQGNEMIVECNDGLDITMVTDFKSILKQAVSQNLPIVLDAAQLERVDGAALQLLAAFFIEANESGLEVSWRSPNEAFLEAVQLTGMNSVLNL